MAASRTRKHTGTEPATAQVEAPMRSQTAPDAVEPVPTVADTGVQMVRQAVHPIVDAATLQPPALDGLFTRLAPHSTIRVCNTRLLENEEGGMTRLLLCKGAQVSQEQALVVVERLREAQGAVEVVELKPAGEVVVDKDGEPVAVIEPAAE